MWFILSTALTVSIDSFVCGFSLAFIKGKKYFIVIGIAAVVFIMCLVANYTATLLSGFLSSKTAGFGGIILIGIGIYNLCKKESHSCCTKGLFKQSLVSGFAVGLDGACANFSLALMGLNYFYVPVIIAAMHVITVTGGILLSKTPIIKAAKKYGFIAPLVLIALGVYKLIGIFL